MTCLMLSLTFKYYFLRRSFGIPLCAPNYTTLLVFINLIFFVLKLIVSKLLFVCDCMLLATYRDMY
jgi:hypothetical protein